MGWSTLSSYTSEVQRSSSNWIHMIGKYLQVYCSINGLISLCGGIPRKKNLWFLSGKNCNILPRPHVFSKMVFIRDFFPEKKGGLFWVGEIILSPWLFRGVQRSFLLTRTNLDLVFQMSLAVCCFFLNSDPSISYKRGRVGSSVDEKSISTFAISKFQL